jgi:hypothetical protein
VCNHAGQSTAAALMVRRTLEAVYVDKRATGNSFHSKLNDLKSREIMAVSISAVDAQDALELAEAC